MAEPEQPPPPGDHDETLTGVNFDFSTPLEYNYAPVLLTLMGESNPMRLVLEIPEVVIGRSKDADISLNDNTTSRRHAKVVYINCQKSTQKPTVHLYDMKSRNGVFVNGMKVDGHVPLRDNARITIGETQLGFYILSIPKRGETPGPSDKGKPEEQAAGKKTEKSEARPAAPVDGKPSLPQQGGAGAQPHVAIVEDDFEFASDLRQRLQETSRFRAVVYRRFENALSGFESMRPNVILLGGDMPGGDCLEMCEQIKSDTRWRGIPIILIFDKFDANLVRNGLKAGAQSYLVKPVENLTQLTNRIDIHMNINRMMGSVAGGRGAQ